MNSEDINTIIELVRKWVAATDSQSETITPKTPFSVHRNAIHFYRFPVLLFSVEDTNVDKELPVQVMNQMIVEKHFGRRSPILVSGEYLCVRPINIRAFVTQLDYDIDTGYIPYTPDELRGYHDEMFRVKSGTQQEKWTCFLRNLVYEVAKTAAEGDVRATLDYLWDVLWDFSTMHEEQGASLATLLVHIARTEWTVTKRPLVCSRPWIQLLDDTLFEFILSKLDIAFRWDFYNDTWTSWPDYKEQIPIAVATYDVMTLVRKMSRGTPPRKQRTFVQSRMGQVNDWVWLYQPYAEYRPFNNGDTQQHIDYTNIDPEWTARIELALSILSSDYPRRKYPDVRCIGYHFMACPGIISQDSSSHSLKQQAALACMKQNYASPGKAMLKFSLELTRPWEEQLLLRSTRTFMENVEWNSDKKEENTVNVYEVQRVLTRSNVPQSALRALVQAQSTNTPVLRWNPDASSKQDFLLLILGMDLTPNTLAI